MFNVNAHTSAQPAAGLDLSVELDALDAYAREWDTITAAPTALTGSLEGISKVTRRDADTGVSVELYPDGHHGKPAFYLNGADNTDAIFFTTAQLRAAARLLLATADAIDPICAPLAPDPLPEEYRAAVEE